MDAIGFEFARTAVRNTFTLWISGVLMQTLMLPFMQEYSLAWRHGRRRRGSHRSPTLLQY